MVFIVARGMGGGEPVNLPEVSHVPRAQGTLAFQLLLGCKASILLLILGLEPNLAFPSTNFFRLSLGRLISVPQVSGSVKVSVLSKVLCLVSVPCFFPLCV